MPRKSKQKRTFKKVYKRKPKYKTKKKKRKKKTKQTHFLKLIQNVWQIAHPSSIHSLSLP